MRLKDWAVLGAFVAFCELAGAVGSLFTAPEISGWYATLARPAIAPPNWVFAPVWTALFALMGAAAFLAWRTRRGPARRVALLAFWLQLALNVLWSALFFGLHSPRAALVGIVALWAAILWSALMFRRLSPLAAALMLPYLLWVSFAAYLTYTIVVLN